MGDVAQLGPGIRFRAERAVLSPSETVWAVVDEGWCPHVEACGYLASVRALDRSPNTERVYAGRVALFLNYCQRFGVDWREPSFDQLHQFLRWLVTEPVVRPGRQADPGRLRSKGTANAIITTTAEFLRFGAKHGWVAAAVPGLLSQPKFLRYTPTGYDTGEDGRFRTVRERTIKFRVTTADPEVLSPDQSDAVLAATVHARDYFLIRMLLETGVRIGEALGTWRPDLHFLARSDALGCRLGGPHMHVVRRMNANGALAKSRYPRSIPVTDETVDAYADYQYERARLDPEGADDAVFVNLFHAPRGRAMSYASTKELFDRLGSACGFPVRPHMFRHTAATRWLEAGVAPDVVQALLGHVSFASTSVYLHASRERMRDAVERTATRKGGSP